MPPPTPGWVAAPKSTWEVGSKSEANPVARRDIATLHHLTGLRVKVGLGFRVEVGLGLRVKVGLGLRVKVGLGFRVEVGLGLRVKVG